MIFFNKIILAAMLCFSSWSFANDTVDPITASAQAMLIGIPTDQKTQHYFYDSDLVRYELYQTNGKEPYNWLFLPGGPGADSCYLHSLIDELELPGNVWLIDLPGNGTNIHDEFGDDFDQWITIFPEIFKRFDQPILVGHSFGGMFPLLFPQLEHYLKGLVVLNSAPGLWFEEAVAYSKQFNLPDFTQEMYEFTLNPNDDTFRAALCPDVEDASRWVPPQHPPLLEG